MLKKLILLGVAGFLSVQSALALVRPVQSSPKERIDSVPAVTQKVAILHFYRLNVLGDLIGYDVHLGDSVICRAKNKWRQTVRIAKDGHLTLWAKTEARREIPIDLIPGKSYYIRCSTTMGIMVARPKLELMREEVGRVEFNTLKPYKKYKRKQKRSRR